MRIGIVGGLCRAESKLSREARRAGHHIEFHDGQLRGPSADALESLIRRADVVVVVTDVNSHAAMHKTKELLRKRGREAVFLRKASKSKLRQLLDELTAGILPEPCPC
ncbi:MAG: DUF2325 domain-containing protein [Myxococcales bacterium]|nr:DUF2325 domain-containing protein [Polyangiaceae bacterium]MDW8251496.1 DUF2325 domain-containing protein [Myxococcales bacterium]